MKISQLIVRLEEAAPLYLAKPGDKVGLQLGDAEASVSKVLLAVNICRVVVEEAADWGAELIITHHPWSVEFPGECGKYPPLARLVSRLMDAKIALYTAHSNLDAVPGGVADYLAECLGLNQVETLQPEPEECYKLVTFIPNANVEDVYQALTEAGAGRIGAYSGCSFRMEGRGTFVPERGARPYIGRVGELCRVAEVRLEMVVARSAVPAVKEALRSAHPYEEPAYDFYLMALFGKSGRGRLGCIPRSALGEFGRQIKEKLGLSRLRIVGVPGRQITQVALHTGSGAALMEVAWKKGAEVFLVGEVGYHKAMWAQSLGLSLVELGHYPTDRLTMEWLLRALKKRLKPAVELRLSTVEQEPFHWN